MATKKKVTKKVVKKSVAKKPATKKAKAIVKVKANKYKRVVLESIGNPAFPDMVFVSAGPKWALEIVGKRYVNESYAIAAIEALDSEKVVASGAKAVKKELIEAGLSGIDSENN
jgi:hypothetical protein